MYIEKISENIINTAFENFDQVTLENAKYRILDVLGCIISGANAPGNSALIELVKGWGGREEAAILVYGGKVPAHQAAMVNSVMARSYDFEATQARVNGINLPSHISGTTVTTALTMGEAVRVSGSELITALVAGDDAACRVLAASGFGFDLGWDNVGTVNAFGAAAIAGRLLGLSPKQLQNAFGIVLNQLAGSFDAIWESTPVFKLTQGLSARNGIFSAELAKAGWTGPKDALLGKFGYYNLYTEGCTNPQILIEDLGKKYYSEVTFKPYPGCRANHTAIGCALECVKNYDLDFNEIDQIILKVPEAVRTMFVGQPLKIREFPQIDAAFSLCFSVANVLLRKDINLTHFQEDLLRDSRITNMADKIIIEELTSSDMQARGAILRVKLKDGREYTTEAGFAKADPVLDPLAKDEVKQKFIDNAAFSKTISEARAEKILTLIENLEQLDEINELTGLVTT